MQCMHHVIKTQEPAFISQLGQQMLSTHGRQDRPTKRVNSRSLKSYFAFCKIVVKMEGAHLLAAQKSPTGFKIFKAFFSWYN